jgi:serine/threonine protein kinase
VSAYNVFLSWSKPRSLEVAKALNKWLPHIVQSAKPWLSDEDIEAGARWAPAIASQLSSIQVGIVCITPENAREPWLNFEAGALSRAIGDDMRVCPYCYDLKRAQLENPLAQFQTIESNREGTFKLVQSINTAINSAVSDETLRTIFELIWPKIEEDLKSIRTLQKEVLKRPGNEMLEEVVDGLRSLQLEVYRLSRHARTDSTTKSDRDPTLGRYHLRDRMYERETSEVFKAEILGVEGFSRTFAVKRLRPTLAHDKDAVADFVDRARIQSSLIHSNIVPVFDFGIANGEYFSASEYIIGCNLARLVQRQHDGARQPIDTKIACYIAFETLQALIYAHNLCDDNRVPFQVIHHDVSPENIMLSLRGEVKLSDFGVARVNRGATKTRIGRIRGNTEFMSPEQARGERVDVRSDLFSLGQVLFYSLTAEPLYAGDSDFEVLFKAALGPKADHIRRFRALPRPMGPIIERALAFDPEERYQSAAEFAEALAGC